MSASYDHRPQIFGTGLIALDLVMSADPTASIRSWAGGTCGNVLSILAYLGWDAYPIARMNGDPASKRVKVDMKRWGVRLDYASCSPTTHTPIVIQEIRRRHDGSPTHRFSWSCPRCGEWLPSFRAVTAKAVEAVSPKLGDAQAFFMDRLSRAALNLARQASDNGAVVIFEPSVKSDTGLFAEALKLAHVIKYSDQRFTAIDGTMEDGSETLVEVQTLGSKGLRFRHRFCRGASTWKQLEAIPAPRLSDTCGAGDWCTAGFIAKALVEGQTGLRCHGVAGVESALRYGQALAAWNCGFEGARGGMYGVDQTAFEAQIEAIMAGRLDPMSINATQRRRRNAAIVCPACPTKSSSGEVSSQRRLARPLPSS